MPRKKTHEEFLDEVKALVGDEYEVIGKYVNGKTKIEMKHKVCNSMILVYPKTFLNGTGCSICFGNKKKTTEQFKKEVFNVVGDKYAVLGEYINSKTKVKTRHEKCGYEYEMQPNSFLNGNRCPLCSGKMRKTTETFKKEVFELVKNEYEVIGEYVSAHVAIRLKHNSDICDNHIFTDKPYSFLGGKRCPICSEYYNNFKNKVNKRHGDEYEVLGEYIDSKTKIKIRHNSDYCDYNEWMVEPASFVTKYKTGSCPICSKPSKYPEDLFVKYLDKNNYELTEKYKGASVKNRVKHKKCNYEFEIKPVDFLKKKSCLRCEGKEYELSSKFNEKYKTKYSVVKNTNKKTEKVDMIHLENSCNHIFLSSISNIESGRGCPKCKGTPKKNTQEFKKEVYGLVGDKYEVLGEYINTKTKVEMKHNICGYVYDVTPSDFLNKRRCPKCAGKIRKKLSEIEYEIQHKTKGEYQLLSEENKKSRLLKIKHNNESCNNYTWNILYRDFNKGVRCPKCAGKARWTDEEINSILKNKYNNNYKCLSSYKNSKTKMIFQHISEDCNNHQWSNTFNGFLKRNGCPVCDSVSSKGEETIAKCLLEKGFAFSSQWIFDDCRDKHPLPFDFVIFNPDKSINCLIEYDGQQHYQSVKHWGGEEAFKQRQHNDQIKNQYCEDNNIKLIRIPYWEFDNIEDILNEELKDLINNNEDEVSA